MSNKTKAKVPESAKPAVDDSAAIRAGLEAQQREMQSRAEAFHQEYMDLMQRTNCRHQPLLSLGFDASVQWKLVPVAMPLSQ